MLEHIAAVKKALRDQHNCPQIIENGIPKGGDYDPCVIVEDGNYDCLIDGKIDHIEIKKGFINCCNFWSEKKDKNEIWLKGGTCMSWDEFNNLKGENYIDWLNKHFIELNKAYLNLE